MQCDFAKNDAAAPSVSRFGLVFLPAALADSASRCQTRAIGRDALLYFGADRDRLGEWGLTVTTKRVVSRAGCMRSWASWLACTYD